jgi:hypothetical protein
VNATEVASKRAKWVKRNMIVVKFDKRRCRFVSEYEVNEIVPKWRRSEVMAVLSSINEAGFSIVSYVPYVSY